MKSAVVALGLMAAMANAYHHPRHFHFRRDNTTTSIDEGALTTLTVIATQTSTVISCAPTVTNCPARPSDIESLPESEKSTVVVTNTVILTETVCPVSEAPAISSSILEQASTLTGTPITTDAAAPVTTAPATATTDEAALTTLTVIATQTSTVISCAATVTNCPARPSDIETLPESEKATFVVTNTVILTETVCPVSEVPAISSSVLEEASSTLTGIVTTSVTPTSIVPTGAGLTSSAALPEETGEGEIVTTSTEVHEIITTKILTITMGGTSTSVITTAIPTTVYTTVIVTCDGGCGGQGKPTKEVTDVSPEQTGTPDEPASEEPTTTTTATTTATTTVTVPGATKTAIVPGESGNTETPGNENGEGVCECPERETVTATVTVPASTVYVTVSHETTGAAKPSSGVEEVPQDNEDDEDDEDDEDEDDDECPAEITTTMQATVTVPYPTGSNSTVSGVAAPTGQAHLRF